MVHFSITALGQGLEVWAKIATQKSLDYKTRELSLRESNRMVGYRELVRFMSGRKDQRKELKARLSGEAWGHSAPQPPLTVGGRHSCHSLDSNG